MPELIEPDAGRHSAWLESHREWGPGLHEDGFGIGPNDEVESAAGFAAWLDRLRSRPARLWWIVEQEVVLGGIALRPFTNDDVLRTGHIGYGIRPSARGRRLATWALAQGVVTGAHVRSDVLLPLLPVPVKRWFGVLALAGLTVFAWILAYSSYLLTMESYDMGSTVPQSIIEMQLYIPQAVSTVGFVVFAVTALLTTLVAMTRPEPIAEEGGI